MTTNETPVVIGIGSNAPDREARMKEGIAQLHQFLNHVVTSEIYETVSISPRDASPFLNAVAGATTTLSRSALIDRLKEIERLAGRHEAAPGIVTLDLDLVIFNGQIIRDRDFEQAYFNIGYRQLLANGAFQYTL